MTQVVATLIILAMAFPIVPLPQPRHKVQVPSRSEISPARLWSIMCPPVRLDGSELYFIVNSTSSHFLNSGNTAPNAFAFSPWRGGDIYARFVSSLSRRWRRRLRREREGERSGPTNAPRKRGSSERANPEPMKKLAANKVDGGSDAFAF